MVAAKFYPGTPQYTQAEFESYRLRIENDKEAELASDEVEALPTGRLWKNRQDPVVASELGWRVFVPFAIVIALILSVALSEVSPRQGRYLKLFPSTDDLCQPDRRPDGDQNPGQ